MEKFNYRSSTSLAKTTGTVVSIGGAVVATLYQGPPLLGKSSGLVTAVSSTWMVGGLLLTLDSAAAAVLIIVQALVVRKCPAVLILMLFYSCFIVVVSAAASAIVEKDLGAWSLSSTGRFIPIILSGLFGNVFQLSIVMWCVRRKGPVFASIFHPIGVIVSIVTGVLVMGETFYLGSLLGAVVVMAGFYAVLWGKAKEVKVIDNVDGKATTPLLQEHDQLA